MCDLNILYIYSFLYQERERERERERKRKTSIRSVRLVKKKVKEDRYDNVNNKFDGTVAWNASC